MCSSIPWAGLFCSEGHMPVLMGLFYPTSFLNLGLCPLLSSSSILRQSLVHLSLMCTIMPMRTNRHSVFQKTWDKLCTDHSLPRHLANPLSCNTFSETFLLVIIEHDYWGLSALSLLGRGPAVLFLTSGLPMVSISTLLYTGRRKIVI